MVNSSEENKAIVWRFWEEVVNLGNLSVADDIFASNYVLHDAEDPANDVHGPDGIKRMVQRIREALPDVRVTIEDQMAAEGDRVVTRWIGGGTHVGTTLEGTTLEIKASGQPVVARGVSVSRISGGRIAESWDTSIGTIGIQEPEVGMEEAEKIRAGHPGDLFFGGWWKRHLR